MSAHQFEKYADRREAELLRDYNDGTISREDYNAEMRELQREARDAYQEDLDEAQERVRDECGW